MARHLEPFECDVLALGPRGTGLATAPDGRRVEVRGGLPGARVAVVPSGRRRGVWTARRTALLSQPPGYVHPPCPVFGTCGGCTLQELDLPTQRRHKHERALLEIGDLQGARTHPPRGAEAAYAYRNKLELSFGVRRFLDEASHASGAPIDGAFLGFHAPGRFDRVVDVDRCLLVSEAMNALLTAARNTALAPDAPPPWDVRAHAGFWRHLVLREAAGGRLAVVVTASPPAGAEAAVERLARALLAAGAAGVTWWVNDGVADVARGTVGATWGATAVEEHLGPLALTVSPSSFFQTNTQGAVVLYETIRETLGRGRLLLDLYCGTGAIGLFVADSFERSIGIEEVAEAVDDARRNAARSGVDATFFHAKVEDALDRLASGPDVHVVVDPPRAGLHPKVTAKLASLPIASLVYVACAPASLGRDAVALRAGGLTMTDVYTVDLFPQTGHVEAVARFTRVQGPDSR